MFGLLKFWLYENRMPLGLVVCVVLLGGILAIALPLVLPVGPIETAQGTMNATGIMSDSSGRGGGVSPSVTLSVDGQFIVLRQLTGDRCAPGQSVNLLRRRTRIGDRYGFTLKGCALYR
jgi:hypothetical protein